MLRLLFLAENRRAAGGRKVLVAPAATFWSLADLTPPRQPGQAGLLPGELPHWSAGCAQGKPTATEAPVTDWAALLPDVVRRLAARLVAGAWRRRRARQGTGPAGQIRASAMRGPIRTGATYTSTPATVATWSASWPRGAHALSTATTGADVTARPPRRGVGRPWDADC